jgi:hypothetical protein
VWKDLRKFAEIGEFCLPPISLSNKIDIRSKINSRTALENDKIGGCYRTVSGGEYQSRNS